MSLIRDTGLIFSRSLRITLRNPIWIFITMFQPLCFFVLFAPLLEKLVGNPSFGTGSALAIFTPGLLIMTALYGTAFVGYNIIDEMRAGVIERMRVTPINRIALLLGRSLRDIFVLTFQAIFLIILAYLFGLKAPLAGALISLGLVVLIGFAMSVTSYSIAMIFKSEDNLSAVLNLILLPLQLLAGITLPLTLAPTWLQKVASFNPLSHAVTASRALFIGDYSDTAIVTGFLAAGSIALVAFYLSAKLFKKSAE